MSDENVKIGGDQLIVLLALCSLGIEAYRGERMPGNHRGILDQFGKQIVDEVQRKLIALSCDALERTPR